MFNFYQYIFLTLIGASIGSFLNVIRFRYPRKISILKPRSFCPNCKNKIPFYFNIPILAWIFLRGKCFFCQVKISISYPFIEFITAALFVLNSFFSGSLSSIYSLNLIGLNIFAVILLISSIIDFDKMIIPNEVILIGSISGFIFNLISLDFFGNESFFNVLYQFVILSLLGAISIEFLNFLISLLIKKDAFGFGDIKFLFLIGCWLGFKGIYLTLLLSLYIGGLFTIILIIFKRISKKGRIPFGPYLSISAYIVGIVGSNNISTILKKMYSLG